MPRLAIALSTLLALAAAPDATAQAPEPAALAERLRARFEIVELAGGTGVIARESRALIEIAGGVISVEGRPLSGAEVRERFGADAALLLQASYLPEDARRALAAAPGALPATAASWHRVVAWRSVGRRRCTVAMA